jgi:hypothetical protein
VKEKLWPYVIGPAALALGVASACGGESGSGVDGGVDAAIAADAQPADAAAPDATVILDPSYGLTGDAQQMATRGGAGGSPYQLICPTGYVAVGIAGSSGSRVDAIELYCQELLEDGSLGAQLRETPRAGDDNDNPYEMMCPDGEAIVGFRGREDASDIRAIGIDCAEVLPWIVEGRGHEGGDELRGGSGGTEFFDLCSRGFFVAAVAGFHGEIIHGLSARCDRAADLHDRRTFGPYSRGSEVVELPPRGGPDARTVILECKDDELPIGYRGRTGSRVDRLQLVCGRLAEDGSLIESGTSIVAGGLGGVDFEEDCPENEAMVGLLGRAGSQLDSLRLLCAPISGYVEDGTGVHPWGRLHGGTGGSAFEDVCPEGMFLRDIMTFPNGVIEAITGRCVAIAHD